MVITSETLNVRGPSLSYQQCPGPLRPLRGQRYSDYTMSSLWWQLTEGEMRPEDKKLLEQVWERRRQMQTIQNPDRMLDLAALASRAGVSVEGELDMLRDLMREISELETDPVTSLRIVSRAVGQLATIVQAKRSLPAEATSGLADAFGKALEELCLELGIDLVVPARSAP